MVLLGRQSKSHPVNRPLLFILLSLVTAATRGTAQSPDSLYRGVVVRDTTPAVFEEQPPVLDSLQLHTFPALSPWEVTDFAIPTLDDMRRYDPIDQPEGQEYARLHNLGTAAKAITPQLPANIGFQVGLYALSPYLLGADSLQFIRSKKAYSDVYYSQGPTSEDGLFKGKFARRFGKGTDFFIEALRIYNLGEYSRLANHHSSLRTGLRYQVPKGRYAVTFLHGNHVLDQQENGGIITDTLLGDPNYQERSNVPVWLTNASFRYRETDYQLTQAFAFRGKVDKDSLGRFLVMHKFRWQDRRFKYSDTSPPGGGTFYGVFQSDDRGIRQYTTHTTLSNVGELLFSWKNAKGVGISLQAGLDHRIHNWSNELNKGTVHNVMFVGRTRLQWREIAEIQGSLQADLGDQIGSFRAESTAGLHLSQWAQVKAGFVLANRKPDLFEEQLVVSQRQIYAFQWEPIQQQSLFGELSIPKIKLKGGVHFALLTNALYFEAPGIPNQIGSTFGQSHLWVSHQLDVGVFHLKQRVSWQKSGDERIPFPAWITRHDLYYEGMWFRRSLRTRIGTELRLISPWKPYGYMPLHGVFYIQHTNEEKWYPQVDVYLSMERLGFRFFIELENAGQMIFGWKQTASNGESIPQVFSSVDGYPMPANWLRFGVAFTFRN
jgi:hypothetical protein